MKKIAEIGNKLVVISAFLFAVSIPVSIALDNVAAGVGVLGIILLLLGKGISPYPPLKPFSFLLIPQIIESVLFFPRKIFKTDFNLHLVPYYSVYRSIKENFKVLEHILLILSISTSILGLSVIFEAFTWQNVKHINLKSLSLHLTPIRAEGFLNHPLTTGGVLFIMFVLFISASIQFRRKVYLMPILFSGLGIVFCESRSYWLGSIVFLLFLVILQRNRGVLILVVSLMMLSGFLYQIPQIKHRFESMLNPKANYSNLDRLALWNAHLKAFLKDYSLKEKLLGAGYKADDLAWKRFRESFKEVSGLKNISNKGLKFHFHRGETHNIYLKYLTKYGVLGFLGFIAFWMYILYVNFTYKRTYWLFTRGLLSGYLGFLAAGFFENNFVDAEVQFAVMFVLGINFALLQKYTGEKLHCQKEYDLQKSQD